MFSDNINHNILFALIGYILQDIINISFQSNSYSQIRINICLLSVINFNIDIESQLKFI